MSKFKRADLVFAKVRGYPPWPAYVVGPVEGKKERYDIFFYGTFESGVCRAEDLFPYEEHKGKFGQSNRNKAFNEGLEQIASNPGIAIGKVKPRPTVVETKVEEEKPTNKRKREADESEVLTPEVKRKKVVRLSKETPPATPVEVKQPAEPPKISRSGRKIIPKKFVDEVPLTPKGKVSESEGEGVASSGSKEKVVSPVVQENQVTDTCTVTADCSSEKISIDEPQDIRKISIDKPQDIGKISIDKPQDIENISIDETQDIENISIDETQDIENISNDEPQDTPHYVLKSCKVLLTRIPLSVLKDLSIPPSISRKKRTPFTPRIKFVKSKTSPDRHHKRTQHGITKVSQLNTQKNKNQQENMKQNDLYGDDDFCYAKCNGNCPVAKTKVQNLNKEIVTLKQQLLASKRETEDYKQRWLALKEKCESKVVIKEEELSDVGSESATSENVPE